jgi:adenine-specific DNA-methyltransferase
VIYCSAFRVRNLDGFPNLTVKKIPKAVLHKCEWGKDDYSLEIKSLPLAAPPEPEPPADRFAPRRRPRRNAEGQATLFAMEGQQ